MAPIAPSAVRTRRCGLLSRAGHTRTRRTSRAEATRERNVRQADTTRAQHRQAIVRIDPTCLRCTRKQSRSTASGSCIERRTR